MKTILLKFAGPLQAWGTSSHFETRQTDRYPSKSAVIGMLAASLGYRREEDEKIRALNALDFGIRIDQQGMLLRDFQIAAKHKPDGGLERTYVTNRYYLQDAVFVAALGSEDEALIETLTEALKSPYFQPFLGRRSLPLTADFFLGISDKDVVKSLMDIPWQAATWYRTKEQREHSKRVLKIYVDANLTEHTKNIMIQDLMVSFSQKGRKHKLRPVVMLQIELETGDNVDEHDAFRALGG